MNEINGDRKSGGLRRYLSSASVWALSFGCIVGWGAFVMPGTTFLPMAGTAGTVIGMTVGALIMLVIGINYHYMMMRCPDAGSSFTYAKETFGSDHGFLSAWFMILAYVSILWANLTALSLIGRTVFGDTFKVCYLYTIAGWDIYLGEVCMELTVLALFGFICAFLKRTAGHLQTVFALTLLTGIIASFIIVCGNAPEGSLSFDPAFVPDKGAASQIFGIIALAPWAFVGFESVTTSAEEFRFPIKRSLVITILAIAAGAVSYILLVLTAAAIRPEDCGNWFEYISTLGQRDGLEEMPVFYALGSTGNAGATAVLGIALISAILTGIIGSSIASSRLLYAMSKDGLLPGWLGKLTKDGTPRSAVLFIAAVSAVIPFLGRTAIGWVVDVITVGSTVAYAYTSASAFKNARDEGNKRIMMTGAAGTVISALIALLLLVPDLLSGNSLSAESYLLLAFWSILGIVYFRFVFSKDEHRRFGSSTVVWIALLFLIFFTSLMWMRQSTHARTEEIIENISTYYNDELADQGIIQNAGSQASEEQHLAEQLEQMNSSLMTNSVIQMALIMLSLIIVFNIYSTLLKREKSMEVQKTKAEENSKAKTVFLSNMSHDIRTPMNAIIGYITLAKREDITLDEMKDYLGKIEGSSRHLLALINDVLEMSRIENGKMELEEEPCCLHRVMDEVRDMFQTQMNEKKITYTVTYGDIGEYPAICDKNRLNRVLLNLISNAYKFTPEGGTVTVTLERTDDMNGDRGDFELRVKDSGIGMNEEFAERVFDAFERERTSTVSGIQGTGLGMAITKSIVDLMGGTIDVVTAPGKGTEFIIKVSFRTGTEKLDCCPLSEKVQHTEEVHEETDFSKMRLLLVDDVEINREIAAKILRHFGFTVEAAINGKEAVDMVEKAQDDYYDAVLMDIQMPVMDGYEAARTIRSFSSEKKASVPIIAMTANAFSEDVHKAKEAGMNAHVAKPIDMNALKQTLTEILK
ncbi:MAG: amino acid permease [Ruminiclostridium sp.]|nr:amino acid permease [Ruminiclostridium sp.]